MDKATKEFVTRASDVVKKMRSVTFNSEQSQTKFLEKMFLLAKEVLANEKPLKQEHRMKGLGITHPNTKKEVGQTIMTEGMSSKGDDASRARRGLPPLDLS